MPTAPSRLPGFCRALFQPGQRVCCALSGGADSTALLLALLDANAEREGLGVVLTAVHVHHGLRGAEADAEADFVQELCARHQVPLAVQQVDTAARQHAHREGLEEAARSLRYAVFNDRLATGQCDAVATAHTLDDQAETVAMKFLRGAWTEGLAGISPVLRPLSLGASEAAPSRSTLPVTGVILRPMLTVSRSAVEAYLQHQRQPWRTDSSNADLSLTRNRIRHELLPLLRQYNPAVDEALARTAALARDDEAFWAAETARVLPGLLLPGKPVRGGGRAVSTEVGAQTVAIELERLRAQPPALRGRLLRAAAATLGCRLEAADTARLLSMAGLPASGEPVALALRPGARLELGNGLHADKSLRELRLTRSAGVAIPKKM